MTTTIGDNIVKIRTEKSISQKDLADLLNMHATHLSRYERNVTSPSVDVVKKIADALNITTDLLIYGTDDDKVKDKLKDNELLAMFSKVQTLKKDDIHCIKSLLNAYLIKTDLQQKLAL